MRYITVWSGSSSEPHQGNVGLFPCALTGDNGESGGATSAAWPYESVQRNGSGANTGTIKPHGFSRTQGCQAFQQRQEREQGAKPSWYTSIDIYVRETTVIITAIYIVFRIELTLTPTRAHNEEDVAARGTEKALSFSRV
jgi:hypothetical protein